MLIRFVVENFLSFKDETEFSLIASKERRLPEHFVAGNDINILKTGIFYGANASGKSNLVKAIDFGRNLLIKGFENVNTFNKHFKLNKEYAQKPSKFHFEIKAGGKFYSYGFAVVLSSNQIIEEWLFETGKNKDVKIFERSLSTGGLHEVSFGTGFSGNSKKRFEVYKEDFKRADKILFLSEINRKSLDDDEKTNSFRVVYEWFRDKLTVLIPESKFRKLNFIGDDELLTKTFDNYLDVFQTGIKRIKSNEIDLDKLDIPFEIKDDLMKKGNSSRQVIFEMNDVSYSMTKALDNTFKVKMIGLEHEMEDGESVVFNFDEESDGTRRLFDFIPALREMSVSDSVFVIDELDRSLHSKLTLSIIDLFIKLSQGKESQLIVTTHESLLLNLDFVRKDEIWFVEKEKNASILYSLDEFKVRNDKIISKEYLLGRYGAIPIFKSFDNLNLKENVR